MLGHPDPASSARAPRSTLQDSIQQFGIPHVPAVPDEASLARRLEELRPVLSDLLQDANRHWRDGSESGAQRPLRPIPGHATTIVVRNIPRRYCRKELEQEWLPNPAIDFLQLVFNRGESHHASYALVNFTSHRSALAFRDAWHGKFLGVRSRTRPLNIASSNVQGYSANLWRYLTTMQELNPARMPSTFSNGIRLDTRRQLSEMRVAVEHQMADSSGRTAQSTSDAGPAIARGGPPLCQ